MAEENNINVIDGNCLRNPSYIGIKPIWDENSKVLMVGSITASDGMRNGFYYSSRWNSFWKLLDYVILADDINSFDKLEKALKEFKKTSTNASYDFKFSALKDQLISNYKNKGNNLENIRNLFKQELLNHHIAICDIYKSCYMRNNGSLDSDIVLNDDLYPVETYKNFITEIVKSYNIKILVANSKFVYDKIIEWGVADNGPVLLLVESPSTSNRKKLEIKFQSWFEIKQYL